jgi:PAS domain S-box-containing protein
MTSLTLPVAAPLILDAMAEAVLAFDPLADRILQANQAAARLFGRPVEDLVGGRASTLHPPSQFPDLVVFTEAVLHRGRAWTRTLSLDEGGVARPLEYLASKAELDGRPVVVALIRDLDDIRRRDKDCEADGFLRDGMEDWRRVEQVFRDIERENQLILRAAGEGIYGINAEGLATFVNPAAERLLGWSAEDLVNRSVHHAVHYAHPDGSHYHECDCPIYSAFRDGETRRVEDDVFWRKDGTPIRVEYTSTPIRDRGSIVGAVVVFRDITARKESEERLRAALDEVEQLRHRLELENAYLQEEIRTERKHHEIIGASAAIQRILHQIELVAATEATVLVTGESGTGKELIARALHQGSNRSKRPMIRVNCAAIPRELFESEFFGHVKGAFTGAVRDRVGRFELADGGTLFMDEVGEIPLELQPKLLRVLQEGHFERVGEERTRTVDVRVIAATNRDLALEVARGAFREDLFYRLNVFPIESVPLRKRPDDIPLLAAHIVKTSALRLGRPAPALTRGAIEQLLDYDWPGNVRELENVIERAVILGQDGRLSFDIPGRRVAAAPPAAHSPGADAILTDDDRRARDRANILQALASCGGRVSGPGGAAALLGVKPTTLASRIKSLGIKR